MPLIVWDCTAFSTQIPYRAIWSSIQHIPLCCANFILINRHGDTSRQQRLPALFLHSLSFTRFEVVCLDMLRTAPHSLALLCRLQMAWKSPPGDKLCKQTMGKPSSQTWSDDLTEDHSCVFSVCRTCSHDSDSRVGTHLQLSDSSKHPKINISIIEVVLKLRNHLINFPEKHLNKNVLLKPNRVKVGGSREQTQRPSG